MNPVCLRKPGFHIKGVFSDTKSDVIQLKEKVCALIEKVIATKNKEKCCNELYIQRR